MAKVTRAGQNEGRTWYGPGPSEVRLPRDYQVVDISTPADPALLATVKLVKHRVVNGDTGTTFLLGSEGLTVVRRISIENDYKTHQMQMNGN